MKKEDTYKDIRAYNNPTLLKVCDAIWTMPFLQRLAKKTSASLSLELLCDKEDLKNGAIFMSNHRDIVMDAAWLSLKLNVGYHIRPYMGMGTNLYGRKWIEHFCKFNRCFSVFRGGTPREVLQHSEHLSGYINSLRSTGESVWIAQREGRAKDGNDKTQDAVIKMLTLYNPLKETLIEQVKRLNICPDSISYEYDPCDFLKAREMQLSRDIPGWKKNKEDDIQSMATGIRGYKGRVIHRITPSINHWLEANKSSLEGMKRNEQIHAIAQQIDRQIYAAYEIFERGKEFDEYVERQIAKIEIANKDTSFLKEKIYEMYNNQVKNHEACHLSGEL